MSGRRVAGSVESDTMFFIDLLGILGVESCKIKSCFDVYLHSKILVFLSTRDKMVRAHTKNGSGALG
jgi:hypothetical protein